MKSYELLAVVFPTMKPLDSAKKEEERLLMWALAARQRLAV